jgi:hypothetical protein
MIYSRGFGGFEHQNFIKESDRKKEKEKDPNTKSKSYLIYIIPLRQSLIIYPPNPMAMAVEAKIPKSRKNALL